MKPSIPAATIARLPVYLRCLSELGAVDDRCSSEDLAAEAGVKSAQVRKDLSYLGSYGTRGVGYNVDELTAHLRKVIGLTKRHPVMIVGAGNLGSALANYKGTEGWGFDVMAIVDSDPEKVGRKVARLTVEPASDLETIVEERGITIGIITVPATAAPTTMQRLVDAGVASILNFAPVVLHPPEGVTVRRVDIAVSLGILAFQLTADSRQPTADSERSE